MSSRRTGVFAKCCLVAFAVASALFVSWPALNWSLSKGFKWGAANAAPCGPCVCDCPPPLSLLNIAPGLVNLSITDCGKHDSDLNREMEKQFVDLLTEELQLQKAVAEEHTHHMNLTYIEARRLASQYQKEAEKCNAATETCEEAREQMEASLIKEKKVTALWERRARKLGWEGE
ncbi:Protein of unknown function DUF1068 [Cinnamomum micranthum f. kanehirae]|uniref:DUF1068 domain-containing protein n=1 Tax=Cinnamomum micranthum f. kanehirae TaxID=337451 RepID=A0A3S3MZN0_9MAGN|nr:Protein of unknown function DUF1068 [Cinnamomum micranthum f. kanehirae]